VSEDEDRGSDEMSAESAEPTPEFMRVEINWTSSGIGDDFLAYLRRSIRIRGGRDDRPEP
jgi:hypothetical protein